jgi:hypothetical protein
VRGRTTEGDVLAAALDIHARDGRVTTVALAAALGLGQSTAFHWVAKLRRAGRWPYPAVGPGKHGPQPSRRVSRFDTPTVRHPSRPAATMEEWRRRAWPMIFGVPYPGPDSPPPPVSRPPAAVRLDRQGDTDD